MNAQFLYVALIVSLTSTCLSPGTVFASKAKFERTKPHVNIGAIGDQGASILVTNLKPNPDDAVSCRFSGDLIATDTTPDRHAATHVLTEHIELAAGQSVSIPIPYPYSTANAEASRREISVEIEADDASDKHCEIAVAVMGYDNADKATQYVSGHRVTKIDSLSVKQKVVSGKFLGYVGGNAKQAAKVIFTRFDGPEQAAEHGQRCDYSGVLHVQGVPVIDGDLNETSEQSYPINFEGPAPVFVDIAFSTLGATDNTRVERSLTYAMRLKAIAACSNWLDIGVQIINSGSGETRSNEMIRIPAHTPDWTDQNRHDPG